nr:CDP-alcohol phosphatidyltransferase family protein [Clostridiales bacterium]
MKKNIKDLLDGAFTVPNLLTVVRIILVPFFAVEYYHRNYLAAVIILAVSGLTDFLDGKIARKFNQVSTLGKLLDPLADKATQITLAVLFFITFRSSDDKMIKAFSFIFLVFLI